MSGVWLEFGRPLCSLLLIGIAIKLMDDGLDVEFDQARGKHTLAARFGRSVVPYALLAGLLSASLNLQIAIVTFLGSYAVGMFTNLQEVLPTRMPAWMETVVALVLSVVLVNWQMALWGLAMMGVIDWLDDVLDVTSDKNTGQWNLANRIGIVETLFLILIALTVAVLTNARLTALTFIALPVIEMVLSSLSKRTSGLAIYAEKDSANDDQKEVR